MQMYHLLWNRPQGPQHVVFTHMKISIVTISFNQGAFLKECIDSVAAQDYDEFEHIVVDAGSVDGSISIINDNRKNFSHLVLGPDRGPADGLNKGFALATGDIFGYINADDILLPRALSKVANCFAERNQTDVLQGHSYRIGKDGRYIRKLYSSLFSPYRFAVGAARVLQPSTFFRAEIFRKTGGFNISNRTCWDSELMLALHSAGGHFQVVNLYLAGFRVHDRSITGTGRLQDEYIQDRERLQKEAIGRPVGRRDVIAGRAHRIYDLASNPKIIAQAISHKLRKALPCQSDTNGA